VHGVRRRDRRAPLDAADRDLVVTVDGAEVPVPAHGAALRTVDAAGPIVVTCGAARCTIDATVPAAAATLRLHSPHGARWSVTDGTGGAWFAEGVPAKWDSDGNAMATVPPTGSPATARHRPGRRAGVNRFSNALPSSPVRDLRRSLDEPVVRTSELAQCDGGRPVDGDEEQQSAAVAVCDGATGDGAEQSGDAAPSTSEADPADVDADDAATTDDIVAGDADETPGESADVEDAGPTVIDVGADEATDEPDAVDAAAVLVGAEMVGSAPRRLHPYLRRGGIALVAIGAVALAVSAVAWIFPSLDGANRRFIEEAQSHGHTITPGEQQMLVLSAARKVCDRTITHDTIRERRSTALSSEELAAVGAVFGPRTRDFTALALETYCSR
jgi:hypothetical protein